MSISGDVFEVSRVTPSLISSPHAGHRVNMTIKIVGVSPILQIESPEINSKTAPVDNIRSIIILMSLIQDMEAFPEHRTGFFRLLLSLSQSCFPVFLALPEETMQ